MSKLLGKYKNDYEDVIYEEQKSTDIIKIYTAYNKKANRECCLKVISKEKLKTLDYNFLLERLNKEQEIQTLCNSNNTVNFYKRLETEKKYYF